MKKLLLIMIMLLLCACAKNTPAEPEPTPTEPEPAPVEPAPAEPEPDEKEYVYQMEKEWVAYDFTLKHAKQTYQIKDGLTLKLEGKEKEELYCQDGKCLVYDIVTINDRDIEVLENVEPNINEDYGYLNLYNLNDELYILNFFFAAQYNSCAGLVFDSKGNIVMTYKDCDLTMNEVYQNQFGLTYTNPNDWSDSRFEVYTANGSELSMEVMS